MFLIYHVFPPKLASHSIFTGTVTENLYFSEARTLYVFLKATCLKNILSFLFTYLLHSIFTHHISKYKI